MAYGTAIVVGPVDCDGFRYAMSCSGPFSSPSLSEWSHREMHTTVYVANNMPSINKETKIVGSLKVGTAATKCTTYKSSSQLIPINS